MFIFKGFIIASWPLWPMTMKVTPIFNSAAISNPLCVYYSWVIVCSIIFGIIAQFDLSMDSPMDLPTNQGDNKIWRSFDDRKSNVCVNHIRWQGTPRWFFPKLSDLTDLYCYEIWLCNQHYYQHSVWHPVWWIVKAKTKESDIRSDWYVMRLAG